MGALDDDFPERCARQMSAQRRECVSSYRFALDRKLSAAAYLLLRMALRAYAGVDEAVVFDYGAHGKPVLRDHPRIHFNLSHCKGAVACALSDDPVGVDVEDIAPVPDALARRVLTEAEYRRFASDETPARLFCQLWTIKESHLKQSGRGLCADLQAISASDLRGLFSFGASGYCGCAFGMHAPLEPVFVSLQCLENE